MRAQGPGESALLLLDAIEVLTAAQVPYAVIGAMAASVHGVVRASVDADALLAIRPTSLRQLESDFRQRGFETELRFGDSDDPIAAVLALNDEHGNRVDFLVGLRGLDPGAFARAIDVELQGYPLRVASLEDFVAMKLFAHGPQDLADARHALEVAGASIDASLLRRLAAHFGPGTKAALDKLLHEINPRD